jgi:Animal haem peroxidase
VSAQDRTNVPVQESPRSAGAQARTIHDRIPAHRGHMEDSFFIVGEGLYSETAASQTVQTNGAGEVRAEAAAARPRRFRFSRLGPKGKRVAKPIRVAAAKAMTRPGGGQTGIPAGYTYLGQFIDHDLTFDKTDLGEDVSPAEMLQNRSPSLDLDSLYGAGPGSPKSAKFFQANRRKLKVGKTSDASQNNPGRDGFDLPRSGSEPLIPDPRNDENLIVAQTHLAFTRFHNRVIDELSSVPADQRFARARRSVTKHYQWMIRQDYLPRICDPAVVDDVFQNGRKAFEVNADPTDVPTMPVEFSVAAFRLGHAMVRGDYEWNAVFFGGLADLQTLFAFSGTGGFLTKASPLPGNWPADWRRLFDFPAAGRPELAAPPGTFNRAMRIDTRLVNPLGNLPPGTIGRESAPSDRNRSNLAFRNLERAKMVRLATGQGMADFLKNKGMSVTRLTKAQIRDGNGGASLTDLTAAQRKALLDDTPLWFYILREAELNGGKLAGVGARIVAETFHRAMEGSRASIVRDPSFKPEFGPNDQTFTMPDLLFFAFEGKENLLNPVKAET